MTAMPAASLAQTVLNETKSPSTTTALTLRLLRALLGLDGPIDPASNPISKTSNDATNSATAVKRVPAKTSSKSTKPVKSRGPAKVVIYTIPQTSAPLSTNAQKLALATETFNKTLKSLSNAARSRKTAGAAPNNTPVPNSYPPRLGQTQNSRPLHETSPNRRCEPPSVQKLKQTLNVNAGLPDPGLVTTAECALTALDCLRSLEKTDNRAQDLQLERGSLILLESLNTLMLPDLAVQEIHKLRARLDHKIRIGAGSSAFPQGTISRQRSHSSHAAVQTLCFDAMPNSEDLCNLVISFQKQVLKTVSYLSPSAVGQPLIETLQLGCKHGPYNIILQSYKFNVLSREKASLHLQALAQVVCSFYCPTSRKAAGGGLSPETAFQLQLAALEIQTGSWNLTQPRLDLERSVWAPFNRIVKRFCQTSGTTKMEQYHRVRDGLQSLKRAMRTNSTTATLCDETELPGSVSEHIAKLAQDCGCHADSIYLLQRSLQASNDTQGLASIICRCNIATLRLQTFSDNPRAALAAVEEALASLKGSLKGSARELETMLLHGVRLRKAAVDTIWKLDKSVDFAPLVDIQAKLRCCSIKVIFAVLNFVSRYIGRPSVDPGASPEQMECFYQKVRLARSIAETTMYNTLTAARSAVDNSASTWAETDLALNDCLALARILDQPREQIAELDTPQTTSSVFLKVSNIYWSQFLRSRETTGDPADLLVLLKNSIHVLEDRPEPERRVGFLEVKYEQMASVYVDLHKFDKAREALCVAIAIHVSSRPFQDVIKTASLHSMRCTWDSETSVIFAFGKTLTAFVKLHFSSHEVKQRGAGFYDDETLSIDERIALLQRQFVIYTALTPTTSKLPPIAPLVRSIIALYGPCQSLHQVQFLLSALKYSSRHHDDFMEKFLEERLTDKKLGDLENHLRTQSSLDPSGVPLFTSLRLQWAFKKSRPSTQLLQDMIESWSVFFSENQDLQTLESHLDDPSFLSSQIQAVIDYTDMQGLSKLRLGALHLQQKMLESHKLKDHATLAIVLIRKGLQCSRLGVTIDSRRALASAKKCIDSLDPQPTLSLEYHLALAECLLNISNLEGYVQALKVARSQYAAAFNAEIGNEHQRFGLSQTRFLCQSAFLISRWQFARGNLSKAIFHAKQCVKLSSQIWAGMQRMVAPGQTAIETNDSTLDSLVHDLSNINFSNNAANERSATRGAAFWPYVSIHCEALMHLSYLLANCGLYQDGIYYADQAQRIAHAVDSPFYVFAASTLLLAHRRKGNNINAGLETSDTRRPPLEVEHASISTVSFSLYLAEASISAGELSAAAEAIEEVTQCLSRIDLEHTIVSADRETGRPAAESVVPILKGPKPKSRTNITDKNTRKAAQVKNAAPQGKAKPAPAIKPIAKGEQALSITSARFETTIDVLKAHIMLSSGKGQDAVSLLARSKDISLPGRELFRRRLIEARALLDEIFKSLSADAVHCVLAETTIAFPSLQKKERTPGKQVILESPVATRTLSRARRPGAANSRKTVNHNTGSRLPPALAITAADLLLEATKPNFGSCPTDMLRDLSVMLNQCFMLSSVLLRQRNYTPVQVALQAAIPNCSAMARESSVITTDVMLTNKSNITYWPDIAHSDQATGQLTSADASLIDPGCLDKLPEQWNIVSMQLSKTRDELSITKLHVGQPPFSLRIPLHRSSSDEPDEVDFGFAAAKIELLDIIKTANKTAHDSKGQSDKQAKKSWWAEREALDDRLKILLENIENVWLGGFRGIMAHQHRHQDLLSRFSGSLLRSLDQHLPSRQKNRKTIGVESNLHTHVLHLFVALGHPDDRNLDDSIADLLYFVIDILQFQGEHNAYDEIDFDIITVEVLDALRCYHEALRVVDVEQIQHTILILDKELLAFPWESLPCLDGRPVSRMPSLSCVESRLDRMRLQDEDASAMSIYASNGAYILNPSSDLTSTQSTFATAFSASLPNFSSIVDRVPTEAEFESYLREKELFLYFGHGSGAQYIRGRNIKRLERCAVTFLMGCSSSKMVECGEFEPYGVPWNYMHASAPAVVGTLWDVTDKDIDRFAMKTFMEWGLIGEETLTEEVTGGKKSGNNVKAKAKAKLNGRQLPPQLLPNRAAPKQKVALDEAVANARSSCVLRYLNGAAPVIYGIPIVLG
jgi:separase